MTSLEIAITGVSLIVCASLAYKLLPFRDLPQKKPRLTIFPKYRTTVEWNQELSDMTELTDRFVKYGFKLRSPDTNKLIFNRGKLLGDFSVKLLRLKCVVSPPQNGSLPLTVEAGWMIAFDTGDLWTFTSELKEKLQTDLS